MTATSTTPSPQVVIYHQSPGACSHRRASATAQSSPVAQFLPARNARAWLNARPAEQPVTSTSEQIRTRATKEVEDATARHIQTLAMIVGRGCFEVHAGMRNIQQLHRWLDIDVYAEFAMTLPRRKPGTHSGCPRVLSKTSRVCRVTQDTYEASVTLQVGERFLAMALRFERHNSNDWRVTALQLITSGGGRCH